MHAMLEVSEMGKGPHFVFCGHSIRQDMEVCKMFCGFQGGRNERHPVNGANVEPSEQIKCASRSAMRERRGGFDIVN